jgi:hypothetical protein
VTWYFWTGTADAASRVKDFAAKVVGTVEDARAEILDDEGPLFDVVQAGTDLLVSKALRAFLEREAPGACTFLPVTLFSETESIDGWSLVDCTAVHKAIHGLNELDPAAIVDVSAKILVATGEEKWVRKIVVRADLADAMIAAGFTGLGFRPANGKRQAGGARRTFPEIEILARTPREKNDLAFIARMVAMPDATAAWRQTLERAPAEGNVSIESTSRSLHLFLRRSPPPRKVKALWFGLGELTDGNWYIGICGSTRFDEATRYSTEWATRPAWSIKEVLSLEPFRGERADYLHPLAFTAIAVAKLARTAEAAEQLRGKWLAVGWNSGDAVILGAVDPTGFVPD